MIDKVLARQALSAGVQLTRHQAVAIDNLTTDHLRQIVSFAGEEPAAFHDRASLPPLVNKEVQKQWLVQNATVRWAACSQRVGLLVHNALGCLFTTLRLVSTPSVCTGATRHVLGV